MSLQSLRNLEPVTADTLYSIGIKTPEQFRQSDPAELYEESKKKRSGIIRILLSYLDTDKSKIVKVCSMKSLANLAQVK